MARESGEGHASFEELMKKLKEKKGDDSLKGLPPLPRPRSGASPAPSGAVGEASAPAAAQRAQHPHRPPSDDELVIASGHTAPFDAEGPWRVQQANLRAWKRWWQSNRQRFPAGHWHLHGATIG